MTNSSQDRYRLLIAEDDEGLRETLCQLLTPFMEVVAAESGDEAIAIVERQPVHLALFDMHMPNLTGLEALQIVRAESIVIPCILMTADWTADLEAAAEQAQAYCVLRKPVGRRALMKTMAGAVESAYADSAFRERLLAN
ncbi:MAG: response regulator [Planctomycetaceae bacterium]